METQKITIPKNSKVSIENGVIIIESNEPKFKRCNSEKMVVEDVLKVGDLVIGWDGEDYKHAGIYEYTGMAVDGINYNTNRVYWEHAVKFESIEQFKKILKGEI